MNKRFAQSGFKEIRIRELEFVASHQFLSTLQYIIYSSLFQTTHWSVQIKEVRLKTMVKTGDILYFLTTTTTTSLLHLKR